MITLAPKFEPLEFPPGAVVDGRVSWRYVTGPVCHLEILRASDDPLRASSVSPSDHQQLPEGGIVLSVGAALAYVLSGEVLA